MRVIDEIVVATAHQYLTEAQGDPETALIFAVADNMHRGYHRKPPRAQMSWEKTPVQQPLDVAREEAPHG
jgi:hypothetical protein